MLSQQDGLGLPWVAEQVWLILRADMAKNHPKAVVKSSGLNENLCPK